MFTQNQKDVLLQALQLKKQEDEAKAQAEVNTLQEQLTEAQNRLRDIQTEGEIEEITNIVSASVPLAEQDGQEL